MIASEPFMFQHILSFLLVYLLLPLKESSVRMVARIKMSQTCHWHSEAEHSYDQGKQGQEQVISDHVTNKARGMVTWCGKTS